MRCLHMRTNRGLALFCLLLPVSTASGQGHNPAAASPAPALRAEPKEAEDPRLAKLSPEARAFAVNELSNPHLKLMAARAAGSRCSWRPPKSPQP
jgi:hypothetical protein